MSNVAMVAVIIRVVGLWGSLYAVGMAASAMKILEIGVSFVPIVSLLAVTLWLVLCVAMVIVPLPMARKLMPTTGADQKETTLDLDGVRSIMLAAIGLYLIVVAMSVVGSFLYSWSDMVLRAESGQIATGFDNKLFVGPVIQFIAGFWLLTGAKGLGGVFRVSRAIIKSGT